MNIISRLKRARAITCLTVSDMAVWFGVSRAAMNSWIVGDHTPLEGTVTQLLPLLHVLEKVCLRKETKNLLPVPLEIRQYQRRKYILEVKSYAVKKFPSVSTSKTGKKVLGTDNQR